MKRRTAHLFCDLRASSPRTATVAVILLFASAVGWQGASAAERQPAQSFQSQIQPLLENYCYECHGYGEKSGGIAFDELNADAPHVGNEAVWFRVLKNVRAGVMPPIDRDQPNAEEKQLLAKWIKYEAFGIDPQNPPPGRVTLRRLNRVEYQNTIQDLMGIEFKAYEEFPPDDSGYGFDNIGDVLTISPLLLEKYMQAAEMIVGTAVPTVSRVIEEQTLGGGEFRDDGGRNAAQISLYDAAKVARTIKAEKPGTYRVTVNLNVNGAFDFDPGRCNFTFRIDDQERFKQEFVWQDDKKYQFEFEEKWEPGEHRLAFELDPLTPAEKKKTSVEMQVLSVKVEGPLEKEHWGRPKNFDRFFTRDAPSDETQRRDYAREVLKRFATRAFRRPVDERMLDRLVGFAEDAYREPGKTFEQGIARAMVAVLSSPRFVFRIEEPMSGDSDATSAPVDEYALASRLSFFLWSTMPDDELLGLAERGELRKNLGPQLKRMLDDRRSREFVENFVGQWLQARDVEGVSINARAVFRRESDPADRPMFDPTRPRRFRGPRAELDGELRRAMRRETEMFFENIVREDRSVLELIDSNYTYLNERLARHYGIEDITGTDMRRVDLPEDSPRGGVLTQGSVLVVTSNPTRTSPVKRGLFILENILGAPPPPPPADVPQLEESEKEFADREPTLREMLELHRSKALCSSCHSRMDPLGLALENFNALAMWRDKERGQSIDTKGKLITGESFNDIRELKRILVTKRQPDFYHCLTEKLLTYALGRGLEYYDVETVDQIVERLERENGRFSALLTGIVESAPFQKSSAASSLPAQSSRTEPAALTTE